MHSFSPSDRASIHIEKVKTLLTAACWGDRQGAALPNFGDLQNRHTANYECLFSFSGLAPIYNEHPAFFPHYRYRP